jgi:tetratricopeptide (TPR) repeat protein
MIYRRPFFAAAAWFVPVCVLFCLSGPARASATALPGEQLLAAEVALTRGEYPEAVRTLEASLRRGFNADVAARAARVAFDFNQWGALERIADLWISRDGKSEPARRFRAIARLQLDRPRDAAADLRVLLKTAYATPEAGFAGLQESLSGIDVSGTAAAAIADLLPEYPKVVEAHLAHAELSLRSLNSPRAIASAERALALRPGDREALWVRARAHVLARQCDAGVGEASGLAAEGAPRDRLLYAWLASACGHAGEVTGLLRELARQQALRTEALGQLAANALEAGRLDEAEAAFRDAAAAGRSPDAATFGLAEVAERRGNRAEAERLYSTIAEGGRAVPAQLSLYRLLNEDGATDLAARVYDQFVTATPERVGATISRAEFLTTHGRPADALVLCERALRVYPDDVGIAMTRAAALDRADRVDAALDALRGLRRARPNDPTVANSLGYTLADRGRDLGEAERLIREALAARPDSAAIQDSMGWVLFRQNRPAEAIPWLERAYAADPEAEVASHLGEARWATGDHEAAERIWREALARATDRRLLVETLARYGLDGRQSGTPPRP